MKLLKAENNQGYFLDKDGDFDPVDKVTKEDLLRLAEFVLEEDEIEFDPYSEDVIKNEAHRILYRNVWEKLQGLRDRREEFLEQRDALYQQAFEKYHTEVSQPGGNGSQATGAT